MLIPSVFFSGDKFQQKKLNSVLLVTGHAARLRNERDQLLKSGVYIESDRIIQEINQQIKEACLIE